MFDSPSDVFDRLREERSDFDRFGASKLITVAGDVTHPVLGLSDEDAELVRSRAQIAIHSAATVKFNEPLSVAVDINCRGAVNMLEFVKSCRRLLLHVHVSTAYVNSNRHEVDIQEELYPLAFDVEKVMQASPSDIDAQSATIVGDYPNTYAVSKSMTEHLVVKNHCGIPLVIHRPAIIGAALKEPVSGWVDQVAGFGGLILATGLGVLTILPGDRDNVLDIVPVDLAVNHLLFSICAKLTNPNTLQPLITHCGTSDPHQNSFSFGMSEDLVPKYFAANPLKTAVCPPQLQFYPSYKEFQTQRNLRYSLPAAAYSALAKATGSEAHAKTSLELGKLAQRADKFMDLFGSTTMKHCNFLADNSKCLQPYTTPNEWWIDTNQIDWERYITSFCSGISKLITQPKEAQTVEMREPRAALRDEKQIRARL